MTDDHTPTIIVERDDPQWRQHARCKSSNPSLFILKRGEDVRPALAVCSVCPVKDPCLRYAIDNNEAGVWGGTTGKQRRRMKRVAKANGELVA